MRGYELSDVLPAHFDRGKPFYPLIMNYLILIHGYLDVASRTMVGLTRETLSSESPVPSTLPPGVPPTAEFVEKFYSHPANRVTTRQAMRPQLLASDGRRVTLDVGLLRDEYESSYTELMSWMMRSAGVLLATPGR
jgi:hypothetical protein